MIRYEGVTVPTVRTNKRCRGYNSKTQAGLCCDFYILINLNVWKYRVRVGLRLGLG